MLVKMIRTEKGSPDGINVVVYESGSVVDIPHSLASVLIDMGAAEETTSPKKKSAGEAPQNKSIIDIPDEEEEPEEKKGKKRKKY